MIISRYKRKCNKCKKEIDVNYSLTIEKGKIHLCHNCATKIIKKHKAEISGTLKEIIE